MSRFILLAVFVLVGCFPETNSGARNPANPDQVDSTSIADVAESEFNSLAMAELKILPTFQFKTQSLLLVDLSKLAPPENATRVAIFALYFQNGDEMRWQLADLALSESLSNVQLSIPLVASQLEFQWQATLDDADAVSQFIELTSLY